MANLTSSQIKDSYQSVLTTSETTSDPTTGTLQNGKGTAITTLTVSGTVNATTLGGTLSTASQPNVTSVGTLSSLTSSGTVTATKLVPTGNVTAGNGMYLPTTNELAFSTNGAERMRIDASGNVDVAGGDIGVATLVGRAYNTGLVASQNPNLVNGSGFNSIPIQVGDIITFFDNQVRTVTNVTDTQLTVNAAWTTSFAGVSASGEGGLGFDTNNVERMRIDASGNVGIGTTSPSAKLDVVGDVKITSGRVITGKNYPQTSTSSDVSIIDTGIVPTNSMLFEVVAGGNQNSGGSAQYRQQRMFYISIATAFNGSAVTTYLQVDDILTATGAAFPDALTYSAVFWNGSSEASNIAFTNLASNQIRIKIGNYTGTTGASEFCYIRQMA
jgi:hypothetical protein